MLKNSIQAIVVDNGITLPKEEKNTLLLPKYGKEVLKRLELPHASEICISTLILIFLHNRHKL